MSAQLHQLTAALYLAAGLVAWAGMAQRSARFERASLGVLGVAALLHVAALALVHRADPPPPLTDPASALSFMAWVGVLAFVALQRRARLAGLTVLVAPMAFGDDERQITQDGFFEYVPVFTPADRQLIVGRRSTDGADLGYWLVPLPGTAGDERQLVDRGAPELGSAALVGEGIGGADGTPAWLTRSAIDPTGELALVVTAAGEVFLVDLAGTPDSTPAVRIPLYARGPGRRRHGPGAALAGLRSGDAGDGDAVRGHGQGDWRRTAALTPGRM